MITQNSTIGFIGLGAMGQRMALRLLTKGFKLVVYDHTSRKIQALAAAGATPAPSIRQLARKSEAIVSCLTTDEAALRVYQRPERSITGAVSAESISSTYQFPAARPPLSREL